MNSLDEIWKRILSTVAGDISPTAYNTWFADCTPIELDDCRLVLHTTSDFKRGILVKRFGDNIKDALSDIFSCEFELVILAGDELEEYRSRKKSSESIPEMEGYSFDNFVVGPSNKFAHAASIAVSENPGRAYNPLFIYGNSGLGKTHLLLAIGQALRSRDAAKKIAYLKGDEFTIQLVQSIQSGTAEDFRQKYRNVDLLLVDDIQFIAGKQATQEEFFHTFNNIYEAGHQIVITSDRPPLDMAKLDDRLRSRFEGGLMADVQPPDVETRMAIIQDKAAKRGLVLSPDVVSFIADAITSNIRQIEGVVNKLTAYREIQGETITVDIAKKAISVITRIGAYVPTAEIIIEETARYYSLTPEDLRGQNRSKNTAMARQVAMYLIRTLKNTPLVEIGREFEDRNHSTVLLSIRKIEDLIKKDKETADTIRDITSNINSRS